MNILSEYMVNPDMSLLDKVKVQAQVLVPVLRNLRAELGEERANQIVRSALRAWSAELFRDLGEQVEGNPRQKWEGLIAALGPKANENVDLEVLEQTGETFDVNVTGCRYAEFFKSLGEPELGELLLCQADFDMVAVGNPEVELSRSQTIMKGAPYCDFRFRMKRGGQS